MSIRFANVLNRTNNEFDSNIGQIRVLETENGLTIEHHVTDRERFYSEYSNFAVKTAQATVEMCRVVYQAKNELSSTEYSEFLKDIGHKGETSTIRKYLAIGSQYDKLIQCTNLLPNSWTSIYTITQLSSDTFDALAATDTDMSKMSGKEIKNLLDMNKPTPPKSSVSTASAKSSVAANQLPSSSTCVTANANVSAANQAEENSTCSSSDILTSLNKMIDVVSSNDTYEP